MIGQKGMADYVNTNLLDDDIDLVRQHGGISLRHPTGTT